MIKANWKWTNDIEDEILKELQGVKGIILHVCSATAGIGDVRIDRWSNPKYSGGRRNFGLPNVIADYRYLPIKSGVCGAVVCDPPYSPERRGKEFPEVVEELVRVTAPRGKIIWVCPWILQHTTVKPLRFWLRASSRFPSYKILSISQKVNGQIGDYENNYEEII